MPRRITNSLLLAVVLALALSGLAGWIAPAAAATPWYLLHRVLGAALVLLLVWKVPIAGGSLRRRLGRPSLRRTTVPGLLAASAALAALGLGLAWTSGLLGLTSFGGYSPLNVHVQLGLLLVPLAVWHLSGRWERRPPFWPLLARRRVLARLGGLAGGALAGGWLLDRVAEASLPMGTRRASGSRHVGSFTGNAYPETIWQFDWVPTIPADAWTVEIVAAGTTRARLNADDLAGLSVRSVDAVLDCTSGWWSEQRWQGWRVGDVLRLAGLDPGDGLAEVRSVTGHCWTFPLRELSAMLLATHVGGEPLTPGHGAPARLVAPGRRGFQWVKWVTRIEVLPLFGAPGAPRPS